MPAELPPDLARLLHDLRGTLNALTMHAQVLARACGGDPVGEESARAVQEQLPRLSAMLADAFAVAAIELGAVEPVDLRAAAETAGREAGGPVRLAAGDWPTVRGDRALLTLALTHVLRNAVEAAGPGPPEVAVAVADGQVRVSVRDRGDGLRTTDPRLLIRPWRSAKPGHRGLGLVTAERIARLHGGALTFNALPDGALVTLSLPAR